MAVVKTLVLGDGSGTANCITFIKKLLGCGNKVIAKARKQQLYQQKEHGLKAYFKDHRFSFIYLFSMKR